jgi:pimeloyl-ACP methyl ester carboxylesterase
MDPSKTSHRIHETRLVPINGVDTRISFRGDDIANPGLLIVGAPGVAFSTFADHFAPWEKHFTLIQWDQLGAGATPARDKPTFRGLARDGIAVVEFALGHLSRLKVAIFAISGGTIAALKMIRARPDLFFAYAATGQVVTWARQDALSYGLILEQARAAKDAAAIAELEDLGPPPYVDLAGYVAKSKYAGDFTAVELAAFQAVMSALPAEVAEEQRRRATEAFDAMRAEIVAFDAYDLGLSFDVPMFFFQGAEDLYHVTSEVAAYKARLHAPHEALERIEGAGASAWLMRDEMLALLLRYVRPLG